jgi:hypothetical protein
VKIGDVVHYVSYGTPGGEYPSVCRAAIITEVMPVGTIAATPFDDVRPDTVGLCVLNPTGVFFNRSVPHGDATHRPSGTWHDASLCSIGGGP